MKNFPVEGISPSSYFTQTAYLDQQYIVAAPEMPITREMIAALSEWGFTDIFSDGDPADGIPAGPQTGLEIPPGSRSDPGDSDKMQEAEKFYSSFIQYVENLFNETAVKRTISFNEIAEKVRSVYGYVSENRRFLMRVRQHSEPADEKFLAFHSVHSTVIAIIIGTHLKLPHYRLIEMGVATLLQDIGMIKLPPQCYLSRRALTDEERRLLYTHPIQGYNILNTSGFPPAISMAVIEHHERENGSGYPRRLTGDKISLYGKIAAVACSYEAISAKRPHRKAKDSFTGMLELLKNEGKQYDETVIRALVYSLSVFPIGLYVLLSDGRKGQVIDINPKNPRYPVVQIFGELTPDGKNITMQTSPDELSIVRPLTPEETGE